jgi:hypothetical protein
MRQQTIEQDEGLPIELFEFTAAELAAYHYPPQPGMDDWTYGSVGTREATLALLRAGRASDRVRQAFERERERWRSKAQRLAETVPSRRRRLRHRDVGDIVDVGRYLADRPDCWERLERGRSAPSVTVGYSYVMTGGNPEQAYADVVGQAVACCWALVEAGYTVRAYACGCTLHVPVADPAYRREYLLTRTLVKDYREPLDVERLLSFGAPGVQRDCHFGLRKRHLTATVTMGTSAEPPERCRALLGVDLFLGRGWVKAGTEEGAALIQRTNMEGFLRR